MNPIKKNLSGIRMDKFMHVCVHEAINSDFYEVKFIFYLLFNAD